MARRGVPRLIASLRERIRYLHHSARVEQAPELRSGEPACGYAT